MAQGTPGTAWHSMAQGTAQHAHSTGRRALPQGTALRSTAQHSMPAARHTAQHRRSAAHQVTAQHLLTDTRNAPPPATQAVALDDVLKAIGATITKTYLLNVPDEELVVRGSLRATGRKHAHSLGVLPRDGQLARVVFRRPPLPFSLPFCTAKDSWLMVPTCSSFVANGDDNGKTGLDHGWLPTLQARLMNRGKSSGRADDQKEDVIQQRLATCVRAAEPLAPLLYAAKMWLKLSFSRAAREKMILRPQCQLPDHHFVFALFYAYKIPPAFRASATAGGRRGRLWQECAVLCGQWQACAVRRLCGGCAAAVQLLLWPRCCQAPLVELAVDARHALHCARTLQVPRRNGPDG